MDRRRLLRPARDGLRRLIIAPARVPSWDAAAAKLSCPTANASRASSTGVDNRLIVGAPVIDKAGRVRRSRLGGLLNYYERAA